MSAVHQIAVVFMGETSRQDKSQNTTGNQTPAGFWLAIIDAGAPPSPPSARAGPTIASCSRRLASSH
jgi:hypothetical protein